MFNVSNFAVNDLKTNHYFYYNLRIKFAVNGFMLMNNYSSTIVYNNNSLNKFINYKLFENTESLLSSES